MSNREIILAEAGRADLERYLAEVLGIDFRPNTPVPTLRAKVEAAQPGCVTFQLPDDGPAPSVLNQPSQAAPQPLPRTEKVLGAYIGGGHNDPVCKILILEGQDEGGKRPVTVGVNGRVILLPRGRPIDVAYRYYEALKNAVKDVPIENQQTHEIEVHQVMAYPHQLISGPTPEQLAEWMDRTQDRFAA